MDTNRAINSNYYMDDLLDQMEKGELKSEVVDFFNERESLNQSFLNRSKRLFNLSTRFYRKSDSSIDMNMSISSETSNESIIDSPFIEEGPMEHFNWELSEHDYDSKLNDSNLNDFYGEYKSILLDDYSTLTSKSISKSTSKRSFQKKKENLNCLKNEDVRKINRSSDIINM